MTKKELQERAWEEYQIESRQVRESLPIHLFQRGSMVWYKYPYPFCKSKVVERTTHVALKRALPEGEIEVLNIGRFSHLMNQTPQLEDERDFLRWLRSESWVALGPERMLDRGWIKDWPQEYEFFGRVEEPRKLLTKLLELQDDHNERLYDECREAVVQKKDPRLIQRMKSRLRRYSPTLWMVLENDMRLSAGMTPVRSVVKLTKIVQRDRKMQGR